MGHRGLRKGPDSSRGWGRGWGTLPASNRFMALPPPSLPAPRPGHQQACDCTPGVERRCIQRLRWALVLGERRWASACS